MGRCTGATSPRRGGHGSTSQRFVLLEGARDCGSGVSFHDIWAGKGEYKKLSLQARLGIFEFMAHIFATYSFPVVVQTFDPDNATGIQKGADWPTSFGPLRFDKHDDLALIFLLMRVRQHLAAIPGGSASACVVVDEGRLDSGRSIVLPGLAPRFVAGAVLFASSRIVHPIQLADFAAYTLNRWQLLRVKAKLSDLDKTLLRILSPVVQCFVNVDAIVIPGLDGLTNLSQGRN
jgi:hypothetical protein